MKKQINSAIEDIKSLEGVNGCLTGSSLLDYFPEQDIDIFVYDKGSFNEILYYMQYNKMYQILEPLEIWKLEEWKKTQEAPTKLKLVTIKFKYNLAVDVNVIFKPFYKNIFDVLSSFDMDIIAKGFDLKTKKYLDLSENLGKVATWNKWNKHFYSEEIWTINRLLRQFERCVKYHKRGYNTDEVVKKYIELLDKLIAYENIFHSSSFDEKIKTIQNNGKILKELFNEWLKKHKLTEKETELLREKIREL